MHSHEEIAMIVPVGSCVVLVDLANDCRAPVIEALLQKYHPTDFRVANVYPG